MNILKVAVELNLIPVKLDISHWEVTNNSPDYVELVASVEERCPECCGYYDVYISIFKNEGEGWGAAVGHDSNELGDRDFPSAQAAYMAIIEDFDRRSFGLHKECA
jgi:hypothetical protein